MHAIGVDFARKFDMIVDDQWYAASAAKFAQGGSLFTAQVSVSNFVAVLHQPCAAGKRGLRLGKQERGVGQVWRYRV
jgi:hypothetical protein